MLEIKGLNGVIPMRVILFLLLPLCVSCATGGSCNPWRGTKVTSVELLKNDSAPAFYFRAGDYYAVRLKEKDVQTTLEAHIDKRGVPALLSEIKKDLPLKTDIDLFRYALVGGVSLDAIEFRVADLLREGRASVVYVPGKGTSNYVVNEIKVIEEVFSGEVSASMFCTPFNHELLFVRNIIFD